MKTNHQRKIKKKCKYGLIVITIVSLMLFSGVIPLIEMPYHERETPTWYDPTLADFLYYDSLD